MLRSLHPSRQHNAHIHLVKGRTYACAAVADEVAPLRLLLSLPAVAAPHTPGSMPPHQSNMQECCTKACCAGNCTIIRQATSTHGSCWTPRTRCSQHLTCSHAHRHGTGASWMGLDGSQSRLCLQCTRQRAAACCRTFAFIQVSLATLLCYARATPRELRL